MCIRIAARRAVVSKAQFVRQGSIKLSSLLWHDAKQGLPKHHNVLIAGEQAQDESPRRERRKHSK